MRTGSLTTATATTATGSRFRQRKLNVKAHLQIIRESDLENGEISLQDEVSERHDPLTSLPKVESGVESKEEKEHHLQAVISASAAAAGGGKVAQIYIPTPDAVPSDIQYDQLYPSTFAQPATYIRFSSTVEDSVGIPYCMTAEDDETLESINATLPNKTPKCSPDQFEQVMNFFEEMSQTRQPFASVDNTPVLTLDEMEAGFDETIDEDSRKFVALIYNYWKDLRTSHGNKNIVPKLKTLKMETAQDADDSDPYVCFRRREIRLPRKTRGRDMQIVEKLKKLRKELEDARQILDMVKKRELGRKDDLTLTRKIFVQRKEVREMKRIMNIQEEEDVLLVNQRTPKKKPIDAIPLTRPQVPIKLTTRPESMGPSEFDMTYLRDKLAQRELNISNKILKQISQHENWNMNYIDRTEDAILGLYKAEEEAEARIENFLGIKIDYTQLPSPPQSVISESASDNERILGPDLEPRIRWAKPSENTNMLSQMHYRTRFGRGGRIIIDRHISRSRKLLTSWNNISSDRYQFDSDTSSDEDAHYPDPQSLSGLRYKEILRQKELASLREQSQAHRRIQNSSRDVTQLESSAH